MGHRDWAKWLWRLYDWTQEMKNKFNKVCTSSQETIWNGYNEYIIKPDQALSGDAVWGQN